jgi:hypothetical protein
MTARVDVLASADNAHTHARRQAKWGGLPQTTFVEGLAQFALSLAGLSLDLSPTQAGAGDVETPSLTRT